jgi:predicted amino acid dehydrogenase
MNDINNINNVVGDELNKILESINLIPDDVRKQIKIDKRFVINKLTRF